MNDLLTALGNFDTQLYLAIAEQRNIVTSVIAVAFTYLNWNGFFWWVLAFLLLRSRGLNRRGIAATATVVFGMLDGWALTEILKLIVRRPRPFDAIGVLPSILPAPGDDHRSSVVVLIPIGRRDPRDGRRGRFRVRLAALSRSSSVPWHRMRARAGRGGRPLPHRRAWGMAIGTASGLLARALSPSCAVDCAGARS